ncbi:unnamed protein product [Lathyrus sativus]|nr:unnamed protein product [Lathyrus sativus]
MATAEEINYDSLPSLPIDLVGEIFCRLPVKLLLQLRCMCKSWNSLISDRNFTRKHLSLSTTRRLHYACYQYEPHELFHNSYPLESVLTNIPIKFKDRRVVFNSIVGSCDGIVCLADRSKGLVKFKDRRVVVNSIVGSCDGILCLANRSKRLVILWNPCFKKFKESPPFENSLIKVYSAFGFGYDHVSENYKVVVLYYSEPNLFNKTKVKVHTLGTNCWKTIESFPFGTVCNEQTAIYLRGTLNWIVYTRRVRLGPCFILSFDLGKESYQKLLPPPGHARIGLSLCVLRDCLCSIFDNHIWVMKEYGIYDSWTKLLSVSYMQDRSCVLFNALYIFDDDRVLLETEEDEKTKVVVYDPKNDTFKVALFKNCLYACLESLISPCSEC